MARVLVVGSERSRTKEIGDLLRRDGHRVETHLEIQGWAEREATLSPEVIVAPAEATEAILAEAAGRSRGFPAPLLLVQHDRERRSEVDLDNRLVDRIVTPFEHDDLLGRVDALVRVRRAVLGAASPADGDPGLRGLGRRLSRMLGSSASSERPIGAYEEVAGRVARWADRRDAFAPGHAERVTALCATMAEPLELGDEATTTLLRAAMLHDIGKVGVPVEVLHQRAPLDEGQRSMIRTHPRRGARLLRLLGPNDDVADVVLHHHEQPDGLGYYGVRGEAVPIAARILAVAEVFDGMTTTRVAQPLTAVEALDRLDQLKGERLDVTAVEALAERIRPRTRDTRRVSVP